MDDTNEDNNHWFGACAPSGPSRTIWCTWHGCVCDPSWWSWTYRVVLLYHMQQGLLTILSIFGRHCHTRRMWAPAISSFLHCSAQVRVDLLTMCRVSSVPWSGPGCQMTVSRTVARQTWTFLGISIRVHTGTQIRQNSAKTRTRPRFCVVRVHQCTYMCAVLSSVSMIDIDCRMSRSLCLAISSFLHDSAQALQDTLRHESNVGLRASV